ncbi:ATP-binding protein [Cupriavidus sp. H19C3]
MLHRLEIENYMSIRDAQVIDLQVAGHAPESPERFSATWPGAAIKAPKVVAFFGANASGKSTVLRTLGLLGWFVRHSFHLAPDMSLPVEPSWSDGNTSRITRMALHFSGPQDIGAWTSSPSPDGVECRYAYEIEFGDQGDRRVVLTESLHYWPDSARRKVRLFERDQDEVVAGKEFQFSGHGPVLRKILRDNASVVSTLAQLDHKPSLFLRDAAAKIVSNILIEKHAIDEMTMLKFYQGNPAYLEAVNRDLRRIDLGIRSMNIESTGNGPRATFEHEGLSKPVPLFLESHGTRNFLQIYPLIASVLAQGGIAVIDEMDLSIHPNVLPEILRWFYDGKRNRHHAQLWMTCQNASLLEELVKEEVYFCEKDADGATTVYGLHEIHGVRRVDNFYRKYMGGVYGAVPNLG